MSIFESSAIAPESSAPADSSNTLCECAYKLAHVSSSTESSDLASSDKVIANSRTTEELIQESRSDLSINTIDPSLFAPENRSDFFPRSQSGNLLGNGFDDNSMKPIDDIARALDQPIFTKSDIERFLSRKDNNNFGSSLDIFNRNRQYDFRSPDLNSDFLAALDKRYTLPEGIVNPKPLYEFGKLQIPDNGQYRHDRNKDLPGQTDGTFALQEFQTDMDSLVERVKGIGKFNFETRRGKKIELEVLRDCGPGDYGICITVDQ